MPTRNVQLTDELDWFVGALVQNGRYESASDVMRAALRALEREDRVFEAKLSAVRAAVDEGDASGLAEGDVFAGARASLMQAFVTEQAPAQRGHSDGESAFFAARW